MLGWSQPLHATGLRTLIVKISFYVPKSPVSVLILRQLSRNEGVFMRMIKSALSAGVLSLIGLALPLAAQNAAVLGTVKDPQQAAVPDATVTLTNRDTGVSVS